MAEPNASSRPRPLAGAAVPLLLIALVAGFLYPYAFLGRSLLPLDLIPVFQPWARHARELWSSVPLVHNPLLDAIQQYYPRRVYMGDALRGGWLPFWNPNVYGGTPFLAAQQGAVLYPPSWLLSLFRPELQFGWSALFHLSLAALGTYLFLREIGLERLACAVGAAAFAFNGWVVVWLAYPNVSQWTLCWLPLALFTWERGFPRKEVRWIAASGAVLSLSLLGGHGQTSDYVLLAWTAWALSRALTSPGRARALPCVIGPLLLAAGLSLAHLLPVLEYVPRTDRGAHLSWPDVVHAGMPLSQFWTFLLPRLFGDGTDAFGHQFWLPAGGKAPLAFIERSFYPGVSVLALAAGGLTLAFRRGPQAGAGAPPAALKRLSLFSLALTLGAVLLAMGTPLYWPLWAVVPGFGQFTAVARVICLAGWGLACLAALGMHALMSDERSVRGRAAGGVGAAALVGAAAAGVGYYIYGGAAPQDVAQILAQTHRPGADTLATNELVLCLLFLTVTAVVAWLASARRMHPGIAGAVSLVLVTIDLGFFGVPYNPSTDPGFLHRDTPELSVLRTQPELSRFLSCGMLGQENDVRQRMPSNLPSTLGLADISGSDSFVPLRYRNWETATQQASGWTSPWSRPGAANLKAASVRYYLTGNRTPFPGLEPVVGTVLQEDRAALPYARLHTNAQAVGTETELLQALSQPSRAPMVALTSGPSAPVFNGPPRVMPFAVERHNGNRLTLRGIAPLPGLLVICEAWDPGWHARVDGQPANPIPADEMFLGLPLTPGHHQVELVYEPPRYRLGCFVSLCALAVLLGLLVAGKPGACRSV